MIDPSAYRKSIVGLTREIFRRHQRLEVVRQYLEGCKSALCHFSCPASAYQHGIKNLREIERLEEIRAGMQMQLEVYYHLNKNKAA